MLCVFRGVYLNFTLFGGLVVPSGAEQYSCFDGTREIPVFRREVQWCADKSLTRPGRTQATATKLGFIQHTPNEAQYTS